MNGHAMSFGEDAGPQIYHSFEVVFEYEDGASFGKFGPTRQPFSSYNIGHHLHFNGDFLLITQVIHLVIAKPEPDDWILRTVVIVRKPSE